ncbi:MAG: hypothetical protein KGI49_03580 [Patescibacteria group bacterium]|nr:hypothetical protein [Patescibacteria group bacterium]
MKILELEKLQEEQIIPFELLSESATTVARVYINGQWFAGIFHWFNLSEEPAHLGIFPRARFFRLSKYEPDDVSNPIVSAGDKPVEQSFVDRGQPFAIVAPKVSVNEDDQDRQGQRAGHIVIYGSNAVIVLSKRPSDVESVKSLLRDAAL